MQVLQVTSSKSVGIFNENPKNRVKISNSNTAHRLNTAGNFGLKELVLDVTNITNLCQCKILKILKFQKNHKNVFYQLDYQYTCRKKTLGWVKNITFWLILKKPKTWNSNSFGQKYKCYTFSESWDPMISHATMIWAPKCPNN